MGRIYTGGCLCGGVRYSITGRPTRPHFCSCQMCQRWSGSPVVAWVDFPRKSVTFDGPKGEPKYYRSSKASKRGFCPRCGGTLCAVDDGSESICMTVGTLDHPNLVVPKSHSFKDAAPTWLKVSATVAKRAKKKKRKT